MTATVDLSETDIFTALRTFLVAILPAAVTVLRGQINRVTEPAGDFVLMTSVARVRLATNQDGGWMGVANAATLTVLAPVQVTIQCDVHGPNGAENSHLISTLMRDDYGCENFKASGVAVSPLYADDPKQLPFINGEGQYEDRWSIDVVLQANPVVSVPQDFANVLTPALAPVL